MFLPRIKRLLLVIGLLAGLCVAQNAYADRSSNRERGPDAWTADDLLSSPTPYALGHRGYGANDGEDPTRPLANTLDAFHQAFTDGIRVVELDLQQTADGKIVVFHDDYLEDFTCISSLTYDELLARKPQIPLFRAVLNSCRHFGYNDRLSGILFAEIKVPVPLCDDANTSAQAEVSESALVAAVIADIRQARMEDQVILNAGSPTILRHVALQAPEIKRALTLNVLQLLPPDVVSQILHMPVVKIPRNDFGLDWYNVGVIARLPAFWFPGESASQPFQRFVGIALAVGSRAASVDKLVLLQAGATAPSLVAGLHGVGLKAIVWTVDVASEWDFVAQAGADGITTNNIAMGLSKQAPLPAFLRPCFGAMESLADGEPMLTAPREDGASLELAVHPSRTNPSVNGAVHVEFVIPDGGPASLELVDIAGRRIDSRDFDSVGAGRHAATLGQRLSPGMYFVRLSHGSSIARSKVVITR